MQIDYHDGIFVALCSFEERLAFKEAGWTFDGSIKRWVTDDVTKAWAFEAFTTDAANAELNLRKDSAMSSLVMSYAEEIELEIPAPVGLTYDPHQKVAIAYASMRSGTLCADPPGLGKTIIGVGLSNYVPDIWRVLVVPPTHLTINWKREWEKWCVKKFTVDIARGIPRSVRVAGPGKAKYQHLTEHHWPDSDVVICPYSMLSVFHEQLRAVVWDLVIFDESHAMANASTQRTRQALGGDEIKENRRTKTKAQAAVSTIPAERRLFMTGTPILSRPVELWPTVHALDPDGIGKTWTTFTKRYCSGFLNKINGQKFWDTSGNSHLTELQTKLRSKFMVRRDKQSVLKDLPDKRRQLIELPKDGLVELINDETIAITNLRNGMAEFAGDRVDLRTVDNAYWDKLADKLETKYGNWADPDYLNQFRQLSPPEEVAFEELSLARKALAIAKVPMICDHLHTYVDAGEKVICFVVHTAMAEALQAHFPTAGIVTGKVPPKARMMAVDRFQLDPECKLIILNITAGGTGYTLNASSIVVFAELDWVPALIEQAEDRAWRRGQKNAVLAQHLVVEGSLDAKMVTILMEKQLVSIKALDADHFDLSQSKDLFFAS